MKPQKRTVSIKSSPYIGYLCMAVIIFSIVPDIIFAAVIVIILAFVVWHYDSKE